ncbi:MAG: nucleotidyltransferase domain-containing protein, partial [Nanoarchaeota archaeon]
QLEKTDFEVLNFLIKNLNDEYSIKEIAERIKKPYVKVHNSIKRLSGKKVINEEIKGKSHYCSINYKSNQDIVCFVSSQRAKEFLGKNKKIDIIVSNILSSISFPNYTLILFGSYAKESADKHSDLDIAIITSSEDEEKAERVMNSIKGLSTLKIHSLEFSYKDFIEMLKSKKGNVGKEIVKNNLILKGYEQFYECIRLAILPNLP